MEPEDKIGVITVQCSENGERETHVEVSYEYIAISDKGREFLDSFTIESYDKFISEWKDLLVLHFKSAG